MKETCSVIFRYQGDEVNSIVLPANPPKVRVQFGQTTGA